MAAPTVNWAVTKIEHPGVRDYKEDCAECLALADEAITMASVTGSVGATSRREDASTGAAHSATVERALAIITR